VPEVKKIEKPKEEGITDRKDNYLSLPDQNAEANIRVVRKDPRYSPQNGRNIRGQKIYVDEGRSSVNRRGEEGSRPGGGK